MQGSSTPRHKARDFKSNLVLIALPLVILWSVFCYLAISAILDIEGNSRRLSETYLPYIKSSFEADYALSNIAYKIEVMARTIDQETLRENYIRAIEIVNDADLSYNPTIQKESLVLTQYLGKLYELKKVLIERNDHICFDWIRHYSSIENIYLLIGDFNAMQRLFTQEAGLLSNGSQLLLPAVNKAISYHRKNIHQKCLNIFDISSQHGSTIITDPEHKVLGDILSSNASLQEKLLYSCNRYETSYGSLQDLLYDESIMRQHFHSYYLTVLNRIDHIRTQSTDVRFGITERLADNVVADSGKLFLMLIMCALCVLFSTIWVVGAVWYLYFLPINRLGELLKDFNITYRIPDPREVSLKEVQSILASIRPTLMEMRSIKQKNRYLKELNTKLGQISYLDGLTHLHNRRALEEVIKRRPNLNNNSAVFMIDIDHFKLLNDSDGHQVGDEVLRIVARTIKEKLTYSKDMVYRYGGEEFCVILTCIDYKSTVDLADRIVTSIENLHLHNSGINGYVTVSLGISFYAGDNNSDTDASIVQHISWADAALYIAKRQGRNQCRVYRPRNDLFFESIPTETSQYTEATESKEELSRITCSLDEDGSKKLLDCKEANSDALALYKALGKQKVEDNSSRRFNLLSVFKNSKEEPAHALSDKKLKEIEHQEACLRKVNAMVEGKRAQNGNKSIRSASDGKSSQTVAPKATKDPKDEHKQDDNNAKTSAKDVAQSLRAQVALAQVNLAQQRLQAHKNHQYPPKLINQDSVSKYEPTQSLPSLIDEANFSGDSLEEPTLNQAQILASVSKEQSKLSFEESVKERQALAKIDSALPKAYGDNFDIDDYEEEMLIPKSSAFNEKAEDESIGSDMLPKRRSDADFIQIYYGDTPVPLQEQDSKKS